MRAAARLNAASEADREPVSSAKNHAVRANVAIAATLPQVLVLKTLKIDINNPLVTHFKSDSTLSLRGSYDNFFVVNALSRVT